MKQLSKQQFATKSIQLNIRTCIAQNCSQTSLQLRFQWCCDHLHQARWRWSHDEFEIKVGWCTPSESCCCVLQYSYTDSIVGHFFIFIFCNIYITHTLVMLLRQPSCQVTWRLVWVKRWKIVNYTPSCWVLTSLSSQAITRDVVAW